MLENKTRTILLTLQPTKAIRSIAKTSVGRHREAAKAHCDQRRDYSLFKFTQYCAALSRQKRRAVNIFVGCTSGLSTFADRPHHQRLSSSHVTYREYFLN
jgi:hypothetical protein